MPAPTVSYEVEAFNTDTASENKIHDDAVAATFGFRGGLVPGVDVYAYLCHQPAARWGRAWVESGTMAARFHQPVYDGERIRIEASERDDGGLDLVATNPAGETCATATAGSPGSNGEPPKEIIERRDMIARAERPAATPEVVARLGVLGSTEVGFRAARAGEYLDDVREDLDLFRTGGIAHPAWLLRQANYVLASAVRLGPWIHVSSECRHFGVVEDGDRVTTRSRRTDEYDRKGHRFVELEVHWVAGTIGDERLVMAARHLAIYQPRGSAGPGDPALRDQRNGARS